MTIKGRVLDGDSNGVGDAAIEIWHADSQGDYAERSVRGWGRVATDDAGGFQFSTMKPGRVAAAGDQLQAPHIAVIIFARGLLKHLLTRIYFPDERSNMHDPVLGLVPDQRRGTLTARAVAHNTFEWNVVLQGEEETVFFEC